MAAIYGYTGNVVWAAGIFSDTDTNVKSFSIDYTADMLDTTDFSATGDRTFIGGLRTWSGSFECNLDDSIGLITTGNVGGAAVSLALTASAGITYTGSAICSGLHPSVSADGLNTVTVDFQGSGALAIGA